MPNDQRPTDVVDVAKQLAAGLHAEGHDYSLGGALALGFWGTVDVYLTIYLPPDRPSECVWVLQQLGCDVSASEAHHSIVEHGFCKVEYGGFRVDVFLPSIPFYATACDRRRAVQLEEQTVYVWDAGTLCVFKMMFFREKDSVDLREMLRVQGDKLDRNWVRDELVAIYGDRDLRISRWDELVGEMETSG
ncbi:MAG: hypothetical protein CMJ64_12130 [Planctomycetaceae bacterium]|nr:hypothetical protein [Planctomycetaceae bacterium]